MKTLAAFLLITVLAVTGCKGGATEANIQGSWKGEFKMPAASKDDPAAKFGEAMLGLLGGALTLDLKPDHKFTLVMIVPIGGDWALNGNIVTLTPKTWMGLTAEEAKKQQEKQPNNTMVKSNEMEKPIRLEVQSDGKTMKALDDMGSKDPQGELIFTKQGS